MMVKKNIFADREKRCPVCKKKFIITSSDWVYKKGSKYYCSYNCFIGKKNNSL